jgi:hypothetical protein
MRARDLPHAYTYSSERCYWSFLCPQGTLSRSGHCELRGSRFLGETWESWGADARFRRLCRRMPYRRLRECQNKINSFLTDADAVRCECVCSSFSQIFSVPADNLRGSLRRACTQTEKQSIKAVANCDLRYILISLMMMHDALFNGRRYYAMRDMIKQKFPENGSLSLGSDNGFSHDPEMRNVICRRYVTLPCERTYARTYARDYFSHPQRTTSDDVAINK